MDIQPLDILKWIGIVLAAGFVGYFGRYLAMLVIDKLRREKPEGRQVRSPIDIQSNHQSHTNERLQKMEKKKAKQEVKRAKKAGKG